VRNVYSILNRKGRDHLEGIGVNRRIILKQTLKEIGVRAVFLKTVMNLPAKG
jgi:hypothetical protein